MTQRLSHAQIGEIFRYAAENPVFVTIHGHPEGSKKHVGGQAVPVEKVKEWEKGKSGKRTLTEEELSSTTGDRGKEKPEAPKEKTMEKELRAAVESGDIAARSALRDWLAENRPPLSSNEPALPKPAADSRVARVTETSIGKDDLATREKLKADGWKYSSGSRTWYKRGHHPEAPGKLTHHVLGEARKNVGVGDAAWEEGKKAKAEAEAYAKENLLPLRKDGYTVKVTDATRGQYAGTPLVNSIWNISSTRNKA